jgi:hypothetical protein
LAGGYYDGPSDYGRTYGRNPLDYERSQEYDRNRDHEPEPDIRDSRDSRVTENRERDVRHPRDLWDRDCDRDSSHYDDRRDVGDSKKDAFERHVSIYVSDCTSVPAAKINILSGECLPVSTPSLLGHVRVWNRYCFYGPAMHHVIIMFIAGSVIATD